MTPNPKLRRGLVWVMAGAATLGVGLGAAGLASAASSTASTAATATTVAATSDTATTPPADAAPADPAALPNGPGETVLTGDTAAKVTAAALAAEPGSTVIRVETDSSGHAYEAHLQLADGSDTTLYFDESFAADGSDDGFGPAPAGMGQHGRPPVAPTTDSTTTG